MVADENRSTVCRFIEEIWNHAHIDMLDTLLAPRFVSHGPISGQICNRLSFRRRLAALRRVFPDLHVVIEDIIAEGDRVVVRSTMLGTHDGALQGFVPSHDHMTWTGIDVYRIGDGMIHEIWTEWDRLSLMQQFAVRGKFRDLNPLAQNPLERANLVQYFLELGSRRVPGSADVASTSEQEDTVIYLRGTSYIVGLGCNEIYTLAEIYCHRVYERMLDFIPEAGWIVFDIGANIGIFTLQQARRGARVYAFEPNPACYRRLSGNVALHGVASHVHLYQAAMGGTPGAGRLDVPDGGGTVSGKVIPTAQLPSAPTPAIAIMSLDRTVPALEVARIDLLKIDVEGAEVEVLQGAMQTLSLVERIIVEYHSQDIYKRLVAILRDHSFAPVLRVQTNPATCDVGLLYARKSIAQ